MPNPRTKRKRLRPPSQLTRLPLPPATEFHPPAKTFFLCPQICQHAPFQPHPRLDLAVLLQRVIQPLLYPIFNLPCLSFHQSQCSFSRRNSSPHAGKVGNEPPLPPKTSGNIRGRTSSTVESVAGRAVWRAMPRSQESTPLSAFVSVCSALTPPERICSTTFLDVAQRYSPPRASFARSRLATRCVPAMSVDRGCLPIFATIKRQRRKVS